MMSTTNKMTVDRPALEPIKTDYRLNFISEKQLDHFQEATLSVLENVGVQFPSDTALDIFLSWDRVRIEANDDIAHRRS